MTLPDLQATISLRREAAEQAAVWWMPPEYSEENPTPEWVDPFSDPTSVYRNCTEDLNTLKRHRDFEGDCMGCERACACIDSKPPKTPISECDCEIYLPWPCPEAQSIARRYGEAL